MMAKKHVHNKAPNTINKTKAKLAADISARLAINKTVEDYSAALLLCLHDKLGFGPVRAQRFATDVQEIFDSILKGYLSIDDIKQTIKDELGIEIV